MTGEYLVMCEKLMKNLIYKAEYTEELIVFVMKWMVAKHKFMKNTHLAI